jgi:hypothetical protein
LWRKACPYLIKRRRTNGTSQMQNALITCMGY